MEFLLLGAGVGWLIAGRDGATLGFWSTLVAGVALLVWLDRRKERLYRRKGR